MRVICRLPSLLFACLLVCAQSQFSQAGQLGLDKSGFFSQTSSSQPTTAANWLFTTQLFANLVFSPTFGFDILTAQLTPPAGSGVAAVTFPNPSVGYYTDSSQLDAAFHDGSYTFTATSGSLSGHSANLSMPDNSFYPTVVPYLTGNSFADLEHYDPTQSLQLSWNSFVPNGLTTFPFVDFFISDTSNPLGGSVFTRTASTNVSSFTSTTLPASTLLPNHQYDATLVFSNEIATPNAAFSGAYNTTVTKAFYTDILFTTGPNFVPEPGSLVLAAFGAAGLFYVIRRRKA